ncbi:alpha/beta hydrolase [Cryomorpha ignava]|uniref:Alpha/beta hydrolase n=1 Tax=Cryomorpha ignava TaxID=101383 RepID=A0A7K3WNU7_9FLAO|nr:alpha/beta hydrolase [Cryomorpha ignava]NEN23333.1 alpha/beta hydrolase [Cryomorpha ignava]
MKKIGLILVIAFLSHGFVHAQGMYQDLEKVSSYEEITYPFPVKKITVSNGIEIAYMDEGNGTETIIFVHGLGSYAPAWKKTVAGLSKNYRCIAIDLPGYGKSSKGNFSGSMTFYAAVISEFAEALNLDNIVLAGHSMGGQISIIAALKYPELVSKLVLIAPAGIETFSIGEKDWFRNALTAKGVMLSSLQDIETNFGSNFYKMPKDAFFMVRDRYAMTGAGEEFQWYCNIIPKCVQGMVNQPVIRDLPKIIQPTLVVFGDSDALIPNRYLHGGQTAKIAEKAGELIPHSKVEVIKKAGHFVMYEKAEEVNQMISGFLNSDF